MTLGQVQPPANVLWISLLPGQPSSAGGGGMVCDGKEIGGIATH